MVGADTISLVSSNQHYEKGVSVGCKGSVNEQGAQVVLLVRPEMGAIAGSITVWNIFAIIAGNSSFLTLIRRNA